MGLPKEVKDKIPHYRYQIDWDNEDKIHIVSITELPGCMTHGKTFEEAMKMAQEAAESYLQSVVEDGAEIPEPLSSQKFSGNIMVRATPEMHRALIIQSHQKGGSLNSHIKEILNSAIHENPAGRTVNFDATIKAFKKPQGRKTAAKAKPSTIAPRPLKKRHV